MGAGSVIMMAVRIRYVSFALNFCFDPYVGFEIAWLYWFLLI